MGLKLRRRREERGLTVTEVAAQLGVSQPAYTNWETGKFYPTADKLPALARALGCTISELFEDPATGAFETDSGQWSFGGPFAGVGAQSPDDTSLPRKEAERHGA